MGIPTYGNQNLVHDLIPSISARLTPASLWWYRYDLSKVLSIASSRARYQIISDLSKKETFTVKSWKLKPCLWTHIYESHPAYTKTSTRPSPLKKALGEPFLGMLRLRHLGTSEGLERNSGVGYQIRNCRQTGAVDSVRNWLKGTCSGR
jgi:hypothetical protein